MALASNSFKKKLQQCVHCGLCLPACPTYSVFGTEMDSPRGRIALMNAAADGRIPLNGAFATHITRCLACRACETACPSGVHYGDLVEQARVALEEEREPSLTERLARRLALRHLLPHPRRLRLLANAFRLYQRSGAEALARRLDVLPAPLDSMQDLLPPISTRQYSYNSPAPAIGEKRGTVAFFHGCVQDAFLADVNAATVRVLQFNGYEVHILRGQTCCGAASLHVGEQGLATELARRNIAAFEAGKYDAIINNAGGCGAILKQYGHLLENDVQYADRAVRFSERVRDISEFLVEREFMPPRGEIRERVTYVDSCHLRHAQSIVQQPRNLLRAIPGLDLVELTQPDQCCGSAGIYNITQPATAQQILDAKMADIAGTDADTIVITNTGCHMQILHGVRRAGLDARVVHLTELLDEAYMGARLQR